MSLGPRRLQLASVSVVIHTSHVTSDLPDDLPHARRTLSSAPHWRRLTVLAPFSHFFTDNWKFWEKWETLCVFRANLPCSFESVTPCVLGSVLKSGAGLVNSQWLTNSVAVPRVVDLSWTFRLYRPKSAPSSQPSANGVQTEGLDYDRLKQVGVWAAVPRLHRPWVKASPVHTSDSSWVCFRECAWEARRVKLVFCKWNSDISTILFFQILMFWFSGFA